MKLLKNKFSKVVRNFSRTGHVFVRCTKGICPFCEKKTIFYSIDYWLRDYYKCIRCGSIPRKRALFSVLSDVRPNYKNLKIHESSPNIKEIEHMQSKFNDYSYSFFYENRELGEVIGENAYNQNLENMTFDDKTFDVFITQDVMEHVCNPERAFAEIARVLKVGGIHVFTTPIFLFDVTSMRIEMKNDVIQYIKEPLYHGNPIDPQGALVTVEYGNDVAKYVDSCCDIETKTIVYTFPQEEKNYRMGLEADLLYVVVTERLK